MHTPADRHENDDCKLEEGTTTDHKSDFNSLYNDDSNPATENEQFHKKMDYIVCWMYK